MIKAIAIAYHGPNGTKGAHWSAQAPGYERRCYSRHEGDDYEDARRVAGEYARDVMGVQAPDILEVFPFGNRFIALVIN